MNAHLLRACLIVVLLGVTALHAQDKPVPRDYTPPEETLAMTGDTPFAKAMQIFSNAFKRFASKPLVYEEALATSAPGSKTVDSRTIGINIPGMYWRDAFDLVLRVNNFWYVENPDYVRIYSLSGKADSLNLSAKQAISTREVEISAVFFEANRSEMEQLGVNWDFLNVAPSLITKSGVVNLDVGASSSSGSGSGSGEQTQDIQFGMMNELTYTANGGKTSLHAWIKAMESENLGDLISSPSITVRSGEEGRIHVGQDFSVKQRDMSGNTTEKFYSAGTIINVTPVIMKQDSLEFVHLKISAERSSVIPDPVSTIVNKTLANTSVILIDGEETVVGGLYTNDVQAVRRGIPILKDLPWWVLGLRYLFGYDEEKLNKKELIIILKARLVPSLEDRLSRKVAEIQQGNQRVLQLEAERIDEMRKNLLRQIETARANRK